MEKKTILIVDDQTEVLLNLKMAIDQAGYDCLITDRVSDAIKIVENFNLHAVITDLCLSPLDCSGIEFAKRIRKLGYSGKIVLMSGYLPGKLNDSAIEGIDAIMEKPFKIAALITWLGSF